VPQLSRAPTTYQRQLTRCKLGVLAATLACATSCTDPTGIGPAPEYLGLTLLALAVVPPEERYRLPLDSCPSVTANSSAAPRRGIAGISATIALPANTQELARPFGKTAGVVYRIPSAGIVAIAYDDSIPTLVRSVRIGDRDSFLGVQPFDRWCPASIGTSKATLYVVPYARYIDTVAVLAFARPMAITSTSPAGRRVNIRLSADDDDFNASDVKVLRLLNAVQSIRWQP
jgi:hypothetical protein